jgi:hypothetical protein
MNKRCQILVSTAFAVGFLAYAQSPLMSQTKQTEVPKITLTGCVERADQMNATGTATTTVDSLSFVLIHATRGTAADAPKGTTGTSSRTPAVDQGRTYRLDGATSKLNPHVGHKVEVTGALDPSAADSAASGDPSSPSSAPRLTVDTIKMLAETCAR